jgi:hypothetical protein
MSYYKITNEKAVQAFKSFEASKVELIEQATKLAAHFGGKPIFSNQVERISFAGINFHNFNKLENNHLWSKPKASSSFASSPKHGKPKAADREALEAIRTKYNAMVPDEVSRQPLLKAIGTDWGNCLFTPLSLFLHDDVIYLNTRLSLIDATEIFGSEYDAAKRAHDAAKVQVAA